MDSLTIHTTQKAVFGRRIPSDWAQGNIDNGEKNTWWAFSPYFAN